jgi:putative transposase
VSFHLQDDDHFIPVCRHVERNAYTAELCDWPDPWRFGSLWRWAHGSTSEKSLVTSWPNTRRANWIEFVAAPFTDKEQKRMERSISRGVPYGDDKWVAKTARRLGLESTLRARGRPNKLPKSP